MVQDIIVKTRTSPEKVLKAKQTMLYVDKFMFLQHNKQCTDIGGGEADEDQAALK